MTTETINIIVRENGSRVVKRNFDLMARQALTTNSAVSVLSRSLLGLTGGVSVAIGIRSFIRTLADFSQALSTVQAITGGTGAEFAALEDEIKRLGATTRFTATQAAEGAQFLARAGFDAVQTTESLSATLLLAQSTATGFGRAADIVTNIMTAFRLETTETARVGDVLAMATNRSNTNLSQLGDAMKFVAPIAKGLNVSLEETVAMISVLSDAGLQGSIAGTGLRRVMTELEVAARKQGATLKELGIDQDATRVSVIGLTAAIQTLSEAGFDTGRAMEFFGQRGGPAFENLGSYIPKIKDMNDMLLESEGFMAEVARVMDDNLNGAILAVQSATEALIISIGDSGAFTFLTAVMGTLAATLRFVASNIDIFAKALQALIAIKVANFMLNFIARNRELAAAIAAGNATQLTAVGIEKAKAASSLQIAQASSVAAAAKVRELQVGVSQLRQQQVLLRQQQASIVIDNQRRIARDALTGRFIAYNAAVAQNIRTNRALRLTEQALVGTKSQLTAAINAQTAATTALSGAQTRQAAAAAASNTILARMTRTFPLLSGSISLVSRGLAGIAALAAANPIGAIIVAAAAATAALVHFSNRIGVADDGLVTLRDVGVASFRMLRDAISPVTDSISVGFTSAINFVKDQWQNFKDFVANIFIDIMVTIKNSINSIIALIVSLVQGTIRAWDILPGALMDIFKMSMNGIITVVEFAMNAVLDAILSPLRLIDQAREAIGRERIFGSLEDIIDLSAFRQETSGAARQVGEIFNEEFGRALSTDFIGNAWGEVLERAREVAAERIARVNAEATRTPGDGNVPDSPGEAGSGGRGKTFADFVRELTVQNELLRLSRHERELLSEVLKVENELKRSLTETERELLVEMLTQNEVLERAAREFDRVNEPAEQYQLTLEALNELLRDGRFNQDQFTTSVRRARIEFLSAQNDMMSGFERGFLRILERTQDLATQTESIITSAFDGMSSAIADLVVTGKADFASLIQSINRQIVKLVFSQAFQMLFGGTGVGENGVGGMGGNFASGLRELLGLQNGGSFMVGQGGASLAPLPGNDNRLVAFRAQDGEQVTVTPRGQQPGGNTQNINVTFNISTPDVQGFRNSESQLATRAARMINRAGRNQ